MPFRLTDVVPWGRSFDEYVAMFDLADGDFRGRILGCGDGPAAFNASAWKRGVRIVSADPLYQFSAEQIRSRIEAAAPDIAEQARRNAHEFIWTHVPSVEALVALRLAAMNEFIEDFERGRRAGRYVDASLPTLPFEDGRFDLALCSHFLFLYSAQHDASFHIDAIAEMSRVASEVRVFPLLELGAVASRHIDAVLEGLSRHGLLASRVRVPYEFQKGGNEMLRVIRPGSSLRES